MFVIADAEENRFIWLVNGGSKQGVEDVAEPHQADT
jgi:hypothetical protein